MDWTRTTWLAALILTLTLGTSPELSATSLDIQFAGLDLIYDGSDIYDAENALGGRGDPKKADPLTSVTFLLDGVVAGTLVTDIWADVLISGVTEIPISGGTVTSSGSGDTFGFDIHTSADGWGLGLNLETFEIFYTGGHIAIGGGAAASSVAIQSLPFELELDELDTVTIAFSSANLSDVTDDGLFLTGFQASGTGNISGFADQGPLTPPVPEPASALLLLTGAMVLFGCRRYIST